MPICVRANSRAKYVMTQNVSSLFAPFFYSDSALSVYVLADVHHDCQEMHFPRAGRLTLALAHEVRYNWREYISSSILVQDGYIHQMHSLFLQVRNRQVLTVTYMVGKLQKQPQQFCSIF